MGGYPLDVARANDQGERFVLENQSRLSDNGEGRIFQQQICRLTRGSTIEAGSRQAFELL